MFFLYDFILCPLQLTSHLPVQLQLRIRANLTQQSQIRAFFTVNCCYREFVGFPFLFPSRSFTVPMFPLRFRPEDNTYIGIRLNFGGL